MFDCPIYVTRRTIAALELYVYPCLWWFFSTPFHSIRTGRVRNIAEALSLSLHNLTMSTLTVVAVS